MDLSSFINFAAVLDNSGSVPVLRLSDTSSYPAGVAPTIQGFFTVIQQPDGISIGTPITSPPNIFWTTALNTFSTELRLNTASSFQVGSYLITYVVVAPGYSNTQLTKTFTLSYTRPTLVMLPSMNFFTPFLSVSDGTNYSINGLGLITKAQSWTSIINSVNGITKTTTGSGNLFDLNYLGGYYDANYSVSLSVIVSWVISASNWVTLVDLIELDNQSFDSELPPSIIALLGYETFMKAQLDGAVCNMNTYAQLLTNYLLYGTIYQHLKNRGCASDFAGLDSYVLQLQKIFNNNVTPPIVHTNSQIPAYDFACGGSGGGSSWNSITGKPATIIIQWTVGQGGFPVAGQNSITDTRLQGYNILCLRNNIQETAYTKALNDGTVTFTNPFTTSEFIYIQSIPL